MSDQDSGAVDGSQGVPAPEASGSAAGQPGSGGDDLRKTLARLEARLETLERGAQSEKDRAIAALRAQINELIEKLAKLEQAPAPAAAPARLPAGGGAPGGGNEDDALVSALQASGVSLQDPEVVEALRAPAERRLAAVLSVVSRRTTGSPPSPALSGPPAAKKATSVEDLVAELSRLQMNPTRENAARRAELKRLIQEAGQ